MKKHTHLESFLHLHQPLINLENIEKINESRIAPVNGTNNLDVPGQIVFFKPRDGTLVRLAESYLEVTFSYNTQTPVDTTADEADITFHNDLVGKMFDSVELYIGNTPIEQVNNWNNVFTELIGTAVYSSEQIEDRVSGASFGWIP